MRYSHQCRLLAALRSSLQRLKKTCVLEGPRERLTLGICEITRKRRNVELQLLGNKQKRIGEIRGYIYLWVRAIAAVSP